MYPECQDSSMREARHHRKTGVWFSYVNQQQIALLPGVTHLGDMQALHMCRQTSCQLR